MGTLSIRPGRLDAITRLSSDSVEVGKALTHLVELGSIVEPDIRDLSRVTCRVRVSPRGWATLGEDRNTEDVDVAISDISWGPPPTGRRGLGSRYLAVAEIATPVQTTVNPPKRQGRREQARQQAEVQTAFTVDGMPRTLHDRFWIEL